MNIETISRSARGLVRPENEDSLLCLERADVFAVADGMGGGAEGARASRMVCDALAKAVRTEDLEDRIAAIRRAVETSNADIYGYAQMRGFRQMGSTVAALALAGGRDNRGFVGHVGDSRVWRLRDGAAELLTRDHSVGAEIAQHVGSLLGAGLTARSNPLAHVLTRAIGVGPEVELEERWIDVRDGDRFLLATDGVHDVIETAELRGLVGRGPLAAAADRLEARVVERGAPDNYSFVLLAIGGAR